MTTRTCGEPDRFFVAAEVPSTVHTPQEVSFIAHARVRSERTRTVTVKRLDEVTTRQCHALFDALFVLLFHPRSGQTSLALSLFPALCSLPWGDGVPRNMLMTIRGYQILQELSRNEWSVLHRGYRQRDNTPVLLKTPRHDPPPALEVALLAHEHEMLQGLSGPGIPKVYDFLSSGQDCCLALEDTGGTPLQALLVARRPDVASFLRLSIRLATILAHLHRQNIAHYSLNPRTVFIHPQTEDVCLMDFSLASSASGGTVVSVPLPSLHLAYVSPEQTGRMNRTADYRSDFYALGVLCYELLTGSCPFPVGDALELVHWHLARTLRPPTEVVPEIPLPLSQIVMKLLAKTPEQRYQSALGLTHDLEICAQEWTAQRAIAPFPKTPVPTICCTGRPGW